MYVLSIYRVLGELCTMIVGTLNSMYVLSSISIQIVTGKLIQHPEPAIKYVLKMTMVWLVVMIFDLL